MSSHQPIHPSPAPHPFTFQAEVEACKIMIIQAVTVQMSVTLCGLSRTPWELGIKWET